MKRILLVCILILISTWLFSARKALVIGNAAYSSQPLKNAVNDAVTVSETLRILQFDVTTRLNINQQDMEKAIAAFAVELSPLDEVLFYYSGHGANLQGENYLIPVGKEIGEETELKYFAYPASLVLNKLQKAQLSIIVLDACRDNPYRGVRSINKGMANMSGKGGSQYIIYSTEVGDTAKDGTGYNSPFTESFVKHISTSTEKIEDLMKKVTQEVKTKTLNDQVPWTAGNLISDFYFNRPEEASESKTESKSRVPGLRVGTEYLVGSLKIESDSYGELYLDGDKIGSIAPAMVLSVDSIAVGTHRLELQTMNSKTAINTNIAKDQVTWEKFSLIKKAKSKEASEKITVSKPKLSVVSQMKPIRVMLDGVYNEALCVGEDVTLSPGEYTVKVLYMGKDSKDYDPWEFSINLREGQTEKLQPKFSQKTFKIDFVTGITDVNVSVINTATNVPFHGKAATPMRLIKGEYTVTPTKESYVGISSTIRLAEDYSHKLFLYELATVSEPISAVGYNAPANLGKSIEDQGKLTITWERDKNADAYLLYLWPKNEEKMRFETALDASTNYWRVDAPEEIDAVGVCSVSDNKISRMAKYPMGLEGPTKVLPPPIKKTENPASPARNSKSLILVEGGAISLSDLKLKVSSFLIGKYETTQAEWIEIMGTNPSDNTSSEKSAVTAKLPVNNVSWFDAIEYCNRRSLAEKLNPCYSFGSEGTNPDLWPKDWKQRAKNRGLIACNFNLNGYRLPAEIEWIYAAAGGLKTNGYLYSGSDSVGGYVMLGKLGEVGKLYPNELGLYDMCGNVVEWCWDIYGPLDTNDLESYYGKASGTNCVRKGGSYLGTDFSTKVLSRSYSKVTKKEDSMGFRVCRTAE